MPKHKLPTLTVEAHFAVFWSRYPNKKGKGDARKAFGPNAHLIAKMLEAIEGQIEDREAKRIAKRFVPEWKHPGTWLRAECWEDEDEVETREVKWKSTCSKCPHDPHPGPCGYCEAISRQNGKAFGCSE